MADTEKPEGKSALLPIIAVALAFMSNVSVSDATGHLASWWNAIPLMPDAPTWLSGKAADAVVTGLGALLFLFWVAKNWWPKRWRRKPRMEDLPIVIVSAPRERGATGTEDASPSIPGPRKLTVEQQIALIAELSPLSPGVRSSQVSFTPSGNESHGYWEGFLEVFTRAGLKPHIGTDLPHNPEEVGVMVIADASTANGPTDSLLEALHTVGIDARLIERNEALGFDLRLYIGPQPL